MNKDSIYKLIGYKGEYNKEVKTKLRKLLKKYHPDHNKGNSETFKLINEVKKELEKSPKLKVNISNETSENIQESITKEDLEYYYKRIAFLHEQNKIIQSKIEERNNHLKEILQKFNSLNEKTTTNNELLCENNDNVNYLKMFRKKYIIYILSFSIFIIGYLLTKNLFFILLIIIIIIVLSIDISKLYLSIKELTGKNNNYLLKNIELFKEIDAIKNDISNQKKIILGLCRELDKNNNDIRFYQNQLNKNK